MAHESSEFRELVVPGLGRHPNVGDVVRISIARSTQNLLRYDTGVREGNDPDDLRRFRVATRRLRSDLQTLRPLLDRSWADAIRSELRWLASEIGPARDLDVLALRIETRLAALGDDAASVGPSASSDAGGLGERLASEREVARLRLLRAVGSTRFLTLLDHLIDAVDLPEFADHDVASASAARTLPGIVRPSWKSLRKAANGLSADSTDSELHDVRIKAKRCRYAAEVAQLACGSEAKRFAKAIRSVQRILGEHQDTVVTETWLRTAAAADPELGFVAGLIVAAERVDRVRLRDSLAGAWAGIDRPELRAWLG